MKETIRNLKRVFKYGKGFKYAFVLEGICTIIQIIIGIILPLFAARQIVCLTENEYNELLLISFALLIIAVINQINAAVIAKTCCTFRRGTQKSIQIDVSKDNV